MFGVLRSRDFRLLWLSQSASVIGDALVIVAIGLYVTRLTGRPSDVGIVLAAYAMPLVVFLLVGGVVADRLPRQAVMVAADIIRGIAHACLAVLIATGAVRLWQMVVIGVVYGSAEAFFRPAYTGLVPQTVDERDIQAAQSLGGVSRELATFASPALATALVLGVGGAAAFALDAATFAVSVALLSRIHPRRRGAQVPEKAGGVLDELREGWSAVRERAWVWATIAAFCVALLVALAPFFVLGASLSRQLYGSEAVFGYANAAWGVGTVSGVLVASRWRPQRPMLVGMLAAIPWPAALAFYAAGPPLAALFPAMAVAGAGLGLFDVWWQTALAERIPPHLLSRVSAWDWMGSLALLPLGYLIAGPVAQMVGGRALLVGGGVVGSVALALALLPRSTRTFTRTVHSVAGE